MIAQRAYPIGHDDNALGAACLQEDGAAQLLMALLPARQELTCS